MSHIGSLYFTDCSFQPIHSCMLVVLVFSGVSSCMECHKTSVQALFQVSMDEMSGYKPQIRHLSRSHEAGGERENIAHNLFLWRGEVDALVRMHHIEP